VKDHAYATYASERDALDAAERIEGTRWPVETGDNLHVEFVDDDRVLALVEREEFAWSNGRQKLALHITKGEDGEVKFDFTVAGLGGPGPRTGLARTRGGAPPPVHPRGTAIPPLTGANATGGRGLAGRMGVPGAPTGPSRSVGGTGGLNIRGRGGYGVPPHLARGNGLAVREEGRLANPMRRTRTRPNISWREGPGARA
jgi:hypothetical protein